jgi:hypothetical protein
VSCPPRTVTSSSTFNPIFLKPDPQKSNFQTTAIKFLNPNAKPNVKFHRLHTTSPPSSPQSCGQWFGLNAWHAPSNSNPKVIPTHLTIKRPHRSGRFCLLEISTGQPCPSLHRRHAVQVLMRPNMVVETLRFDQHRLQSTSRVNHKWLEPRLDGSKESLHSSAHPSP